MLTVPPSVSIFLYTKPTDMRKGFDGLSGLVREQFQADPTDGSLFLLVNRRRDRLKILHFDGTGFWLYDKLLLQGTFECLESDQPCVTLDTALFAMLLCGVSLTSPRRKRFSKAA